ncbi:T-cell surface glycoprotein CD3 epsilon chain [Moschus berezovskii]|uniref:T-cell surface glycoprotein CD3 epsilon chain n=1 Tax=Moschus berezovskii TaxID=68408 RepID=UPI0024446238|nr:T-cell surface glycoprotein CD3 epsilon chain [Moschus berezovskii]XP_055278468.1 T-cell surface glycoprotein CD3 epsilon chain [Moschus berezovskii]
MQLGNLWQVLGLCLLLVGAWAQDDAEQKPYEISISGNTVELTCPTESENQIEWKKNGKEIHGQFGKQLLLVDFSEMDDSGYYQCFVPEGNSEDAHLLYLKARVCENCMEVNLMAVATIIVVDICVTLGLLLLVYYWSKSRKAKATPMTRGAGAGSRPRGQNRERPPPVPNPDYEPIRKGQRDLYAGLNQRGV